MYLLATPMNLIRPDASPEIFEVVDDGKNDLAALGFIDTDTEPYSLSFDDSWYFYIRGKFLYDPGDEETPAYRILHRFKKLLKP